MAKIISHLYFSGCFDSGLTTVVHELLHTLGFVHEHTRPDRDNFISVNTNNIQLGKEKNFEIRKHGTSDFFEKGNVNSKNTPYDVLSLLHYGPRVSQPTKERSKKMFNRWSF